MNGPERLPTKTYKSFTDYLWGALAVFTCPCHSPILAVVLVGMAAGVLIGEHRGIAVLILTGSFVLPVMWLLRALRGGS